MEFRHSTRVAWGVAAASLALWATSAPIGWGQAADGAPCMPAAAVEPASVSNDTTTFHVCGANAETEQAIAQLIDGHAFDARLATNADGCADLTIHVLPQVVGGSSTSHLAVALGSQDALQLDITSEAGATRVSINQG